MEMMKTLGNDRLARQRRASERGVQLVEMAIVAPILILLLAATAEFGNYFYTYTTLSKATRVAGRYVSSQSDFASSINKAKNMAVCGCTTSCAAYGSSSCASVLPSPFGTSN